jgi:hypothetical protein
MEIMYKLVTTILCLFSVITIHSLDAQEQSQLEGRWDLMMDINGEMLPSWLEVRHSGRETLVGRFVYAFGSARPISEVKYEDGSFNFSIPPQWEPGKRDMYFSGQLEGEELKGVMIYTDGKAYNWTASRAPDLPYTINPKWGKPILVFNGDNLDGWLTNSENQWIVKGGILTNPKAGANLISNQKFQDFKLQAEFRYPEGSNSGLYLRGRYEVQIMDSKGEKPSDVKFGGVYGFLTPNEMVAKAAGEWQTYDITLIGNRVTIVANGKSIIQDQIIPGITGGALDSNEGMPGPILIQGDHGPIEFRRIVVTPRIE